MLCNEATYIYVLTVRECGGGASMALEALDGLLEAGVEAAMRAGLGAMGRLRRELGMRTPLREPEGARAAGREREGGAERERRQGKSGFEGGGEGGAERSGAKRQEAGGAHNDGKPGVEGGQEGMAGGSGVELRRKGTERSAKVRGVETGGASAEVNGEIMAGGSRGPGVSCFSDKAVANDAVEDPVGTLAEARHLVDLARESTFPFLESSEAARSAYALASLWWAELCLLEAGGWGSEVGKTATTAAEAAAAALRACDLALLRGGLDEWAADAAPIIEEATRLQGAAPALTPPKSGVRAAALGPASEEELEAERRRWADECPRHAPARQGVREVPRVATSSLSVARFRAQYLAPSRPPPEPVVLAGLARDWPAMTLRAWSDFEYLKQLGGTRLVSKPTIVMPSWPVTRGQGTDARAPLSRRYLWKPLRRAMQRAATWAARGIGE